MNHAQNDNQNHREKVPVARPNIAAEKIREPGELDRFPNRDTADHRENPEDWQNEIRSALERVVFALHGMTLSNEEVITHHRQGIARKRFARNYIAPFAVEIDESEINLSVDDEHPHHSEVPVACAGKPAAKREHARDCLMLERIAAESLAAPRERGIRVENAKPASHHDRQCNRVHPMGDSNNGMMVSRAFHITPEDALFGTRPSISRRSYACRSE